jgi:small ligand-binding sensory domain FIST
MIATTAGAGVSTDLDVVRAAAEAAAEATRTCADPNLVCAFVSQDHRDSIDDLAEFLNERFPNAAVVGCVSQGIVAGAHELETGTAVSLWCAHLPDTRVQSFSLEFEEGDGEGSYRGWPDDLPPDAALILFVDNFSIPAEHLLAKLNDERPGTMVGGGVVNGVRAAGEARLIDGRAVRTSGAVGVAISGRVRVDLRVSQGCKPIGSPAIITRADRQIIFELAGGRPIDHIREMWNEGSPRDRALLSNALFIGVVTDEYKTEFHPGDFLVRSVVGANPAEGWVAVGDVVEAGQTVQFHVRDPESAGEGLRDLIAGVARPPAAALMFTCNGRGSNMFDVPSHDAATVHKGLGEVPLAGFFANGELGPVGYRNFLHSFSASLAFFVDSLA